MDGPVATQDVFASLLYSLLQVIYRTLGTVFHHEQIKQLKRVENATRSGVFFMKFELFDLAMKYCVECLKLLLKK